MRYNSMVRLVLAYPCSFVVYLSSVASDKVNQLGWIKADKWTGGYSRGLDVNRSAFRRRGLARVEGGG